MRKLLAFLALSILCILGLKAQNDTMYIHLQSGLVHKYATSSIDSITFLNDPTTELEVGDTFGGGIVAYILEPGDIGFVLGQVHGLIAAPNEIGIAEWGCYGTAIGVSSVELGIGATYTSIIIDSCQTQGIAARLCFDIIINGYVDWHLPSKDELNKLYLTKDLIGNFGNDYYWSSSETLGQEANYAWFQIFQNGIQGSNLKYSACYVRPVRYF